eukprot:9607372-Prorocentrum_lima.AAC.1
MLEAGEESSAAPSEVGVPRKARTGICGTLVGPSRGSSLFRRVWWTMVNCPSPSDRSGVPARSPYVAV